MTVLNTKVWKLKWPITWSVGAEWSHLSTGYYFYSSSERCWVLLSDEMSGLREKCEAMSSMWDVLISADRLRRLRSCNHWPAQTIVSTTNPFSCSSSISSSCCDNRGGSDLVWVCPPLSLLALNWLHGCGWWWYPVAVLSWVESWSNVFHSGHTWLHFIRVGGEADIIIHRVLTFHPWGATKH